jgi:transcriptional regulator with XRE-family HTH domain
MSERDEPGARGPAGGANGGANGGAPAVEWPAVGHRLRRARLAAGLTQKAAAEAAGVHHVSLSRWEHGAAMRVGDLRQLAAVYGVAVDRLLHGGAPVPAPPANPAETKPGYWEGRVAEIADQLEAATLRLRAFQGAADRWEHATVVQRERAEIAAASGSAPRPTPEVMEAVRAHQRARLAEREAAGGPVADPADTSKAPAPEPAPRQRTGGGA